MSIRPVNDSSLHSRPSKVLEFTCVVRSAFTRHPTLIHFFFWMIFAMTFQKITWRAFRGIRIAALRRSPMFSRERSSTATASATVAPSRRRHSVDDRRSRDHPPGNAQRRSGRPDARVPVVGQPPGVAQNDGAALPGGESAGNSGNYRRRRHARARRLRHFLGEKGSDTGIAADPVYVDVSVPPGRRKRCRLK